MAIECVDYHTTDDGFRVCNRTGSLCCQHCEDYQQCSRRQCPEESEVPTQLWDCLKVARYVGRGDELLSKGKTELSG